MTRILSTLLALGSMGAAFSMHTNGDGEAWVVVHDADTATMSGTTLDLRRARKLAHGKSDFMWFRKDGKEYVVEDKALIARIDEATKPQEELGRAQGELGRRQGKLGRKQAELGRDQAMLARRQVSLEDDDRALERAHRQLNREQEQLGREQEALGREQSRLGKEQERVSREVERVVAGVIADALRSGAAVQVE